MLLRISLLGLLFTYNKDISLIKLNLGAGVYRTKEGKPLVLNINEASRTAPVRLSKKREQLLSRVRLVLVHLGLELEKTDSITSCIFNATNSAACGTLELSHGSKQEVMVIFSSLWASELAIVFLMILLLLVGPL